MLRNSIDAWGWPARALHWIVAVLVLGLFAHGLLLEEFPREAQAYQLWLHAAFGASLFAFAAAGFVWWLMNTVPKEPPGTPGWQSSVSRIVHWALYALIFAAVLAGWMLAGTHREPTEVQMFGVITMPAPLSPGSALHEPLEETHELAAYALMGLVALHVAAALWHHFVLRDGVLMRMLGRKRKDAVEREAELV